MIALRRLIASHRQRALLVALAVLSIRLILPTGYMPSIGERGMSVTVCTGMGAQAMEMARGVGDQKHPDGGSAGVQPCSFAGLGLLATGAIDPPLLLLAFRFAMRTGLLAAPAPIFLSRAYLRPPLRGPPRTA